MADHAPDDAEIRQAMRGRLTEVLAGMFPLLGGQALADIAARVDWVRIRRDQLLFRQGDPGDSVYVLVSGRLRVIARSEQGPGLPDQETVLNELASGESVGEMALITGQTRSADVLALRDCELARLSRDAFLAVVRDNPDVLMNITRTVIRWLRKKEQPSPRASLPRAIALVCRADDSPSPLGGGRVGEGAPLADLARRLADALARLGSVLLLSSDRLASLAGGAFGELAGAGDDDPRWAKLAAWIDQQEALHDRILFQADGPRANAECQMPNAKWQVPNAKCQAPNAGPWDATPWTRFCLRQADLRLLAMHRSDSGVRISDRGLTAGNPKSEIRNPKSAAGQQWLLVIHPDGSVPPTGTADCLAGASNHGTLPLGGEQGEGFTGHCHIRWNSDADIDRLARILAGRSVGLVLGGGGARGLAHIGVIAALAEAGIPIDLIGGTSMGAAIGAMHALGMDPAEMVRANKEFWLTRKPFSRLTLPLVSLFGGRRFDAGARASFGGGDIEDLWVDYFAVASNLSSGELAVLRRGPVWKAVRASASLPVALPPLVEGGDLFVDGGVLNNLPGDVMRQLHGGPTIVVNVRPKPKLTTNCPQLPSPWKLLWSRIRGRGRPGSQMPPPPSAGEAGWGATCPGSQVAPEVPSIVEILEGTMVLSSQSRCNAVCEDADFCLSPPVTNYSILQFDAIDDIVRIGYEYTRERMAEVKEAIGWQR